MTRFFLAGIFVSSLIAGHVKLQPVDNTVLPASNESGLDMMVTGNGFDKAHISKWKAQNELFKKCGECAFEDQPFPGDLKGTN